MERVGLRAETNSDCGYGGVEDSNKIQEYQMSIAIVASTRKLVPTQAETAVAHRKRRGSMDRYRRIQHLEAVALLRCSSKPSLGNEDEGMWGRWRMRVTVGIAHALGDAVTPSRVTT